MTGYRGAPALIVGSNDDPHAAAVANAVAHDAEIILLDVAALERSEFTVTPTKVTIDLPGKKNVTLSGKERGWMRRVAPADWDADVSVGSADAAVKASWLALLSAVIRVPDIQWLTNPTSAALAENKLLQYAAAASISVPCPSTVVTSDAATARDMLGESFVIKPLGPAHFTDGARTRALFAQAIHWDDVALRTLANAPFIAQELVNAARHLRVVTVGRRAWVAGFDVADETPIDWRQTTAAHTSFVSTRHARVVGDATALSVALDVGYSSQDWIEDVDGAYYFLDLNPGGQWLFLPFADEVTAAIADWLGGVE